jgi:aminoglycoside 2''-phosphotransferase
MNTSNTVAVPLDWKAIEAEGSGLTIRSTQFIGEGWTAVAYRVNDDLVFKFPKRHEEWKELDREIAFLAYARPRLPLPVVEHLHQVRESEGAPFGYAVYRYLAGSGVEAKELSPSARTALAHTLAEFLRALHDMIPGPLAAILPREDPYKVAMQYVDDAKARIIAHLSDEERRKLFEFFSGHVQDPQALVGRARVVHADLSAVHVLHAGQRITGILDWGDVSLGDPDYDFSYLYQDFGEAFVRDMARCYGHPDPDHLIRKAKYFTLIDQIGTILYGADRALPGDAAESWQRLHALLR